MQQLYAQLPCLVMEDADSQDEQRLSRRLISIEEVIGKTFWSVESRLVDSLGTIARGLGREFGLNEFLTKFATDSEHLGFNPLLPDAWQFIEWLGRTHSPDKVEFSRRHQQVAIRWASRQDDELELAFQSLITPEYFNRNFESYTSVLEFSRAHSIKGLSDSLRLDTVEDFSGDDDKIQVVSARTGIVLMKESLVERLWQGMKLACTEQAKRHDAPTELPKLIGALVYFSRLLSQKRVYPSYRDIEAELWFTGFESLSTVMKQLGLDVTPPRDLEKAFDFHEITFDAQSYWRNWNE